MWNSRVVAQDWKEPAGRQRWPPRIPPSRVDALLLLWRHKCAGRNHCNWTDGLFQAVWNARAFLVIHLFRKIQFHEHFKTPKPNKYIIYTCKQHTECIVGTYYKIIFVYTVLTWHCVCAKWRQNLSNN